MSRRSARRQQQRADGRRLGWNVSKTKGNWEVSKTNGNWLINYGKISKKNFGTEGRERKTRLMNAFLEGVVRVDVLVEDDYR